MSARPNSKISLASLALLLAGSLGACAAPVRKAEATPSGSLELLEALQPGDIVVAPVRNQTGSKRVPLDELRAGLSNAIIGRMYNPLDTAYVDKNWVESSFKGSPAPDGLLVMAVTQWNVNHLYSTGKVSMQAELLLFAGGSTTGEALWGMQVNDTVDLSDGKGNPPAPSPLLMGEAAERLAVKALASLPMRDPVAAHEPKL